MVRAAFFDLDKTILDTSSNVALSGPFIEAGLMNRRTAITSVLVQLPYLLAGADESRMEQMAQALGRMGRGWNAAFLEATVEDALERTIQPVCYAQALARIEQHKRAGDVVVIASASVEQVVRPIAHDAGGGRGPRVAGGRRRGRVFHGRDHALQPGAGQGGCLRGPGSRARMGPVGVFGVLGFGVGRAAPAPRRPPLRGQPGPRACARWRSARAGPRSRSRPRCASCRARFPRPRRSRCPSSLGVAVGAAACSLLRR